MRKKEKLDFLYHLMITAIQYNSYEEANFYKEYLSLAIFSSKTLEDYAVEYLKKGSLEFNKKTEEDKMFYLWETIMPNLLDKYTGDLLKRLMKEEKQCFQNETFAYKNKKQLLKLIKTRGKEVQKKDLEKVPITKSLELVKKYLYWIDSSSTLCRILEQGIETEEICIWNAKENEIPKKVIENLPLDEYFDLEVSVSNTLLLNAPCNETIKDAFGIVHEFFHYVTLRQKRNLEEEKISEKFLGEVASKFHEKYFYCFLKETENFETDLEMFYEMRKSANNDNVDICKSIISSFEDDFNLETIDNEFQEILCGTLVINKGNLASIYRYFVADEISDYLILMILSGKVYLLDRLQHMVNSLGISSMDPLYFISYLECSAIFYDFVPISTRYPKRMEEKRILQKKV